MSAAFDAVHDTHAMRLARATQSMSVTDFAALRARTVATFPHGVRYVIDALFDDAAEMREHLLAIRRRQ